MLAKDFAGSTVRENPPTKAGDTDPIPGPGEIPHAAEQLSLMSQLLSPCALTTEVHAPRAWSQQDKPLQ